MRTYKVGGRLVCKWRQARVLCCDNWAYFRLLSADRRPSGGWLVETTVSIFPFPLLRIPVPPAHRSRPQQQQQQQQHPLMQHHLQDICRWAGKILPSGCQVLMKSTRPPMCCLGTFAVATLSLTNPTSPCTHPLPLVGWDYRSLPPLPPCEGGACISIVIAANAFSCYRLLDHPFDPQFDRAASQPPCFPYFVHPPPLSLSAACMHVCMHTGILIIGWRSPNWHFLLCSSFNTSYSYIGWLTLLYIYFVTEFLRPTIQFSVTFFVKNQSHFIILI